MENLSSMLEQNIDILCVAETKLDSSYPTNQFHLQGYKTPYRFDVSSSSGGILVYIKESLPSKTLNEFSMDNDIQAIHVSKPLREDALISFLRTKNIALNIRTDLKQG